MDFFQMVFPAMGKILLTTGLLVLLLCVPRLFGLLD